MFEFSIKREELLKYVSIFSKSFESNKMHDVFKCSCLEMSNGVLSLSASDGVAYCKIESVPFVCTKGEVSDFKLFIYTDLLLKILSTSNKDRVFIEPGDVFLFKTESMIKFSPLDFEDFGYIIDSDGDFKMLGDLGFVKILNTLLTFASKEMVRPELSGVSISEHLYVGTQGSYGAVHSPRVEDVFNEITVSAGAIRFLNALDYNSFNESFVSWSESSFYIKADNIFYACRVPDTKFPYEALHNVLNKIVNFKYEADFNLKDLFGAINRVCVIGVDRFSQIGIDVLEDKVKLIFRNESGSVASEDVLFASPLRIGSGEFTPMTFYLGWESLEYLKKLFSSEKDLLTITIISDSEPIFVRQENSGYTFYTTTQRKM